MLIKRSNIFETNSSSTHSLALCLKPINEYAKVVYLNGDGKYHLKFRNFEGEVEQITSLEDKIAFLLQLSMQGSGYYYYQDSDISQEDLEDTYEQLYDLDLFKKIEELLILHNPSCRGMVVDDVRGHIDHQTSSEYYRGEDFLEDYDISLEKYLFGNIILLANHD